MIKIKDSLKKLIGRVIKMVSNILIQFGIMCFPLAVTVLILADEKTGATFVLMAFVCLALVYCGYWSLKKAVEQTKQEMKDQDERDNKTDRTNLLLEAIAEKFNVDMDSLNQKMEVLKNERNKSKSK